MPCPRPNKFMSQSTPTSPGLASSCRHSQDQQPDWALRVYLERWLTFPDYTTTIDLNPDMVQCSASSKQVFLIELFSGWTTWSRLTSTSWPSTRSWWRSPGRFACKPESDWSVEGLLVTHFANCPPCLASLSCLKEKAIKSTLEASERAGCGLRGSTLLQMLLGNKPGCE